MTCVKQLGSLLYKLCGVCNTVQWKTFEGETFHELGGHYNSTEKIIKGCLFLHTWATNHAPQNQQFMVKTFPDSHETREHFHPWKFSTVQCFQPVCMDTSVMYQSLHMWTPQDPWGGHEGVYIWGVPQPLHFPMSLSNVQCYNQQHCKSIIMDTCGEAPNQGHLESARVLGHNIIRGPLGQPRTFKNI